MSLKMKNHTGNMAIQYHKHLPLIRTGEFDFYRCVEFNKGMYGKTVSELHSGNLRLSRTDNRYSNLFIGQRLSYWADSLETAKAEIKGWGASDNMISFIAYDDGSSTIPTVYPRKELVIVDGEQFGFNEILRKVERHLPLNYEEQDYIDLIAEEEPDCLLYKSEANSGSKNYLFFEHGFKKLSLKEVILELDIPDGIQKESIVCAVSCDYSPILESYGKIFLPNVKIGQNDCYLNSDEYMLRKQVYQRFHQELVEAHNGNN